MCPGFPKFEYYKEGRFPIPQGGHQPLLWRLLSVRVGILSLIDYSFSDLTAPKSTSLPWKSQIQMIIMRNVKIF